MIRAAAWLGAAALLGCSHPTPPRHDAATPVRVPDAGVRVPDASAELVLTPIAVPGGDGGIGFDDLQYAPELGRVLVPAGRTGALDLLDPDSGAFTRITGFRGDRGYKGGHGEGTTSATFGGGRLWAIDRSARRLDAIDPKTMTIVAHAALAAGPDYVRWVEPTGEIWVSEPNAEQIEVFAVPATGAPHAVATIRIAGGPESLVVSPSRKRVYTHLWKDETLAIDLVTRKVVARWKNGCRGSRGIALDEARGWLMAGCDEGKATVLDVDHDGKLLGSAATGDGVDVIAYAPGKRHLYVPGADGQTVSVLAVGDDGALTVLATAPTARGAHCAVTDDAGHVWVCDPQGGRLLAFTDSY